MKAALDPWQRNLISQVPGGAVAGCPLGFGCFFWLVALVGFGCLFWLIAGHLVNHKRVARIMLQVGLAGLRLRRRHRTTVTDPTAVKAPDLLERDFTAQALNT